LDLADVCPARKGRRRVDLGDGVERMRPVARILADELIEADREIGARHAITAILEHEIAGRYLELPGSEGQALADHFLRSDRQRTAVADERARAERAGADQHRTLRIARAQRDRFRRDAENVADDLPQHGLLALAPS